MTFEDIQSLLKGGIDSLPEPELKAEWQKVFDRMVVHSRGVPPSDLLRKTFPNEEQEIMKYREDNYEPITSGTFDKGFDNLYRSLAESNWSKKLPETLDEYLKQLTVKKISFWQYLFKIVLRRKIEDPNGLLVPIPYGPGIDNPAVRVDVKLELVLSSQIKYWEEDCIIFKSCEKSIVSVRNGNFRTNVESGDVYYILTDNQYIKYFQIGEKEKMQFALEEWYDHNLEEKPLIVLGGRPTGKIDSSTGDEYFYFNSDFHAFVAHANEALRDKSIHQGVKVTSAYPIRVMDEMPCDSAPKCSNGVIYDEEGKFVSKCGRCQGTGNLIPTSVYKGVILNKKKKAPFTEATSNKPFEYIYPSVDILKHMGEESDQALLKAEKALQIKYIEMAQSGTAKAIDREDQDSMLFSFNDYFFDVIIKKTCWIIYKLIEPAGTEDLVIIKPISFRTKDEESLQVEFTEAIKNDVPQGILVDIYMDWIKKRFSGNDLLLKLEEVSLMYAPNYVYPIDKRNELKLSGGMDANDYIKANRVNGVLRSIYAEKKDAFFNLSDEQFVIEIDKRMAIFLEQLKPPALPDFGKQPPADPIVD